jgi:hypothetical protein
VEVLAVTGGALFLNSVVAMLRYEELPAAETTTKSERYDTFQQNTHSQ